MGALNFRFYCQLASSVHIHVARHNYMYFHHTHTQHLSDLGEIPGLCDDLTAQKENFARTFTFKAFRCFYLAESYVVMKKWPEAVGLFDRASAHVIQAIEQYRGLEQTGGESTIVDKVKQLVLSSLHVTGVASHNPKL